MTIYERLVTHTATAFERVGIPTDRHVPVCMPDGCVEDIDLVARRTPVPIACGLVLTSGCIQRLAETASHVHMMLRIVVPGTCAKLSVCRHLRNLPLIYRVRTRVVLITELERELARGNPPGTGRG